jgi:hypothetical protein
MSHCNRPRWCSYRPITIKENRLGCYSHPLVILFGLSCEICERFNSWRERFAFVDISAGFGHTPLIFRGIFRLLGWQATVEHLHFA